MKKFICTLLLVFIYSHPLYPEQSIITQANGYACLNEDRTKKETERIALKDAKRNALEYASSYINSESKIKNSILQKDIIEAYSNGHLKIIESSGKWDNQPPRIGDCYKVSIKAEIIPDKEKIKNTYTSKHNNLDNPVAPLQVKVWTNKKAYQLGEKIKIFFKGNKPFYARIIYKQADGNIIQILPNPYRQENFFQGGIVYSLPSGPDKFDLEITPPIGEENIIFYASTKQLGDISLKSMEFVYSVPETFEVVELKTRGIKITEKNKSTVGEFYSETIKIKIE